MEAIRQALANLQNETERGVTRRKDADLLSKILETEMENKSDEIARLQQRLELLRRFIILAGKWDVMKRKLWELEQRIGLAETKADGLHERLTRVAVYAEHKTLQKWVDDLLEIDLNNVM